MFKKFASFMVIWILIFSYCTLAYINRNYFLYVSRELELFLPIFTWIILIYYLTNPFVINKRKIYFWTLIKDITISPCLEPAFLISFGTSQFLSLVIPLRDFFYTICYTSTLIKTGVMINMCQKSPCYNI